MKTNKIILRDSADSQFDDLVTFNEDVSTDEIIKAINKLQKENPYYTNEDVYKVLDKFGSNTIEFIGQYEIIEY